jgi:hypothetical protein
MLYRIGPITGLIVIAVGTGGIKPCVSAFAGDQFNVRQVVTVSFMLILCLIHQVTIEILNTNVILIQLLCLFYDHFSVFVSPFVDFII